MPDRARKIRGNDPKFSSPAPRPRGTSKMRRLTIRGETWHWSIDPLRVVAPDGARHNIVELPYYFPDDGEGCVEPSHVVDHINRRILGYTDQAGFPAGALPRPPVQPDREGCIEAVVQRGRWQLRWAPWVVEIFSPEDVKTQHRSYEVLGMPLDEWMDLKAADMKAAGTSFDALRLKHGGIEGMNAGFMFDAPSIPKATPEQLAAFIETHHLSDRPYPYNLRPKS